MKDLLTIQTVTTEEQLHTLKEFLRKNSLPSDDIKLNNSLFITYHDANENLVGSGGLELYHDIALLRSLAVSPEVRGQLFGKQIVNDLLQSAKEKMVSEIYLLTQSAMYFFAKFGFEVIDRDHAPEQIKTTSQFSGGCPSTAHFMKLIL